MRRIKKKGKYASAIEAETIGPVWNFSRLSGGVGGRPMAVACHSLPRKEHSIKPVAVRRRLGGGEQKHSLWIFTRNPVWKGNVQPVK